MQQDSKIAAASYIIVFFNDVETLTNFWANYNNYLNYVNHKYIDKEKWRELQEKKAPQIEFEKLKDECLAKCEPEERDHLTDLVFNLRFWINRSYVKFNSLKKQFRPLKESEKKINELWNKLSNPDVASFIPNNSDVTDYCLIFNDLFLENVLKEALENAQETYAKFSAMQPQAQPMRMPE